jgi:imidazolonepropionase
MTTIGVRAQPSLCTHANHHRQATSCKEHAMKQTVWHHLKLCPQGDPQHTLLDAAIAVENGKIVWLG